MDQAFIRAAEVWVPDGPILVRHSGAYGPHSEFGELSRQTTFRRGEGLPGAVWSTRRPELWKELGSHFARAEAAAAAGITAAVGFPVFRGAELSAVVVLLCGGLVQRSGCVEVWSANHELMLLEHAGGYYGELAPFEKLSSMLQLQIGTGLPGVAWERGEPLVMEDVRHSGSFMRASLAREWRLQAGFAVPLFRGPRVEHVLVLLSSEDTPLAQGFEVWRPKGAGLEQYSAAYSAEAEALGRARRKALVQLAEDLPGRVLESGLPHVFDRAALAAALPQWAPDSTLQMALALPVHDGEKLRAVACLLI